MTEAPIESLCDELEKLADATKPGSWATWKANGTDRFADVVDGDGQLVARAPGELDASFIARCDPPTVKRLVGELREARSALTVCMEDFSKATEFLAEKRETYRRERDEARAELAALVERVEAVVPYVVATLPRGGWTEPIGDEWGRAHLGRSSSSIRQLEGLVQAARAALSGPTSEGRDNG